MILGYINLIELFQVYPHGQTINFHDLFLFLFLHEIVLLYHLYDGLHDLGKIDQNLRIVGRNTEADKALRDLSNAVVIIGTTTLSSGRYHHFPFLSATAANCIQAYIYSVVFKARFLIHWQYLLVYLQQQQDKKVLTQCAAPEASSPLGPTPSEFSKVSDRFIPIPRSQRSEADLHLLHLLVHASFCYSYYLINKTD